MPCAFHRLMHLVQHYFPAATAQQLALLHQAYALFVEWNAKINMVSRKDIDQLAERHVLHSLSILRYIQFAPGTQVLDVGTGGGFPGLPLAILQPQAQFTLIDSIGKKIKVVQDIVQQCGIGNVQAIWGRVEEHKAKYDFVTGRAVTNLPAFVQAVRGRVHCRGRNALPNGILYLKGGEAEAEVAALGYPYQLHSLHQQFATTFFETKQLVYLNLCG